LRSLERGGTEADAPDVGAAQRDGTPSRILHLESQRPFVISDGKIEVPIVLADSGFWSSVRLESADIWMEFGFHSYNDLTYRDHPGVRIGPDGVVDSTNLGRGTLVLPVSTPIPADSIVRIHLVVSAWSDSLGGRRLSEVAYFRGVAGDHISSAVAPRKGGSIRFEVVRQAGGLRLTLPASNLAQVEIVRADGKRLWSGAVGAADGRAWIPTAGIPGGTWIVRATSGGSHLQGLVAGF